MLWRISAHHLAPRSSRLADARDALENLSPPPRTKKLQVGFNKRISPKDYEYSIRHIKVLDPDSQLPYLLGDALSVNWTNDDVRVRAFLDEYGLNAEESYSATPLEGVSAGA